MKHYKLTITLAFMGLVILSLVALPAPALAQSSPVIRAEVDRTTLSTDEYLLLTVAVNSAGGQVSQPLLPNWDSFNVRGQNSSNQVSIINGDMTSQMTYQYRLQPTRTGDLMIDPIVVEVNGQSHATEPIIITVVQGTAPPPKLPRSAQPNVPTAAPNGLIGEDLFAHAEIDNPTPYQGEQIGYTFRFYQAVNLPGRTDYRSPAFSGFWHDQDPVQNEYYVEIDGRTYLVTEIQEVLFPTLAGEMTIDPATIAIDGGFFSRGSALNTDPVQVNVLPYPDGAPVSFRGAVGKFDINSQVDRSDSTVGDTVTLTITLEGQGNIELAPDPVLPISDDWRAFDSTVTTNTWFEDKQMGGSKTLEWVLVPKIEGQLTIPAVEYAYFDPSSETYHTLLTDAITIDVVADANAVAPMIPAVDSQGSAGAAPAAVSRLAPIKAASSTLAAASTPLTQRTSFWLLWLLPVALVVGQIAWQKQRQQRLQNAASIRSKKAAKQAQNDIRQAKRRPQDTSYAADRILSVYLSAKLDRPITGLTQAELTQVLEQHGANEDIVGRTNSVISSAEFQRYAPDSPSSDTNTLADLEQLIAELETTLN